MIDAWEDKMAKLSAKYGEVISAKMKVAVLHAMLPKDLQERVLDKCAVNWDGATESEAAVIFSKIKEEVKNIAKSRHEMITPKPMEVDRVQTDWSWWNDEPKETENYEEAWARAKAGVKEKASVGHAARLATELQSAVKEAGMGKVVKAKSGQWTANDKGDGKGCKGGWTAPMVRACFGCGSTAPLDTRLSSHYDPEGLRGQGRDERTGNIVLWSH